MKPSHALLLVLPIALGSVPSALSQSDVQPGRWELSIDLSVPASPGFAPGPMSLQQCVTAADAADPARLLAGISNQGAGGCAFSDRRQSPGHVDFSVSCEGGFGISGRGSVDYTPNAFQGTLNLDFSPGAGAGGRTGSVSRVSGKRLGSC